jgi:predicted peroxiredoxin
MNKIAQVTQQITNKDHQIMTCSLDELQDDRFKFVFDCYRCDSSINMYGVKWDDVLDGIKMLPQCSRRKS